MANDPKPHLIINDGYYQCLDYKYPKTGRGGTFSIMERNRAIHGTALKRQLEAIKDQFQINKEADVDENLIKDGVVYVEFTSAWGYALKFESLDRDSSAINRQPFQLLNIRSEKRENEDQEEYRSHATLLLKEKGVSEFIKKVEEYLIGTNEKKGPEAGEKMVKGTAKNSKLLSNIELIKIATLKAFWTDGPEIPFPETDESIWWEVWFRKSDDGNADRVANVVNNLQTVGCQIGEAKLEFPEHIVRLIKGTITQLGSSLLLLDNLAELRKPVEIADIIYHSDKRVEQQNQTDYLEDLVSRTDVEINEHSTLICILDSGANNQNPLIGSVLPEVNRYSLKEGWGKDDSCDKGGHGTGVASLALYGDLIEVINSSERIRIFHGIESYKIFNPRDLNDPDFYAAVTIEAVNTPVVDRPEANRIYCMTVTDKRLSFNGRPSAWSAAIDEVAFGSAFEPRTPQIFIVSGGNVEIHKHDEYPNKNFLESIHDPAQAYNAITVGAYTRKDRIDVNIGLTPLALNGDMSPCNSTSLIWYSQWPNKPDIVMEGGNSTTNGTDISDDPSLKLLAVDAEYPNFLFQPFGDTSAAAALAAKLCAELRTEYPALWPETIRGLVIHSADWTDRMLQGKTLNMMSENEKSNLLRTFGYGIPSLARAKYSYNNSLTLIAESEIQPYKLEGSAGKYNDFNLYELPWPKDVLESLHELDAKLTITLSYYIEPNPGAKQYRYSNNYHYHSHSLDFAVIKPDEPVEIFRRRISANAELPEDEINNRGEPWAIGRKGTKGSIRKDFVTMSAEEMSKRNCIAIFPKNGWYKTRKKLQRFNEVVRYSLIISIETQKADLYTPVFTAIENRVDV
ncbi:MAG TPA: S8 family peptidase [Arachidicoccus sp.]|nr:S8 family peptidase [Arachidicoccus sp.]